MATKNTALRNALAQVFSDVFDTGTGTLEIGTTSMGTTLVTYDINSTQSTGVTTGVWTVDFDDASPTAAAGAPDTAAEARMRDSGTPTYEITGITVSTTAAGTGDIQYDSTSITSGQTVTLSSFTITVPAATA